MNKKELKKIIQIRLKDPKIQDCPDKIADLKNAQTCAKGDCNQMQQKTIGGATDMIFCLNPKKHAPYKLMVKGAGRGGIDKSIHDLPQAVAANGMELMP